MADSDYSNLISNIFRSRHILLNLLERQNYTTSDYSAFNLNEINSMFKYSQLDMLLYKNGERPQTEYGNIFVDTPEIAPESSASSPPMAPESPPMAPESPPMAPESSASSPPMAPESPPMAPQSSASSPPMAPESPGIVESVVNAVSSAFSGGANKGTKVYVKYHLDKAIRDAYLRNIKEQIFEIENILTKEDTLIIIVKEEVNETIENLLKEIWEREGIFIIIHSIKRLLFNILEHSYVPPHRILNDEEDKAMRLKFNVMNDSQLPEISRFDPVAKAIGIRPGQICEIDRPSKTAIISKYYRICL
jgi:DNA-directed RNA polymerase subunit H (RpoH/RPB5)